MTDNHRQFFSIFLPFPILSLSSFFPFPLILKFLDSVVCSSTRRLLPFSLPFYISLYPSLRLFLSFLLSNKYNIRNSAIRLNVRIILFPSLLRFVSFFFFFFSFIHDPKKRFYILNYPSLFFRFSPRLRFRSV